MKQLSDFKYDDAYEKAVGISKFLNSTIKFINVGPSVINCFENTQDSSIYFPIDNYLSSSCAPSTIKDYFINTIDESMINENTKTIELKGDDLLYNVFYIKNLKVLEGRSFRLNVPDTSFVIINFENSETTFLNLHRIEFPIGSNLNAKSVIYNFLNNHDIVYGFENDFNGSILAPYSTFFAVQNHESKKVKFNGQIFAKNLFINEMLQTCSLFEAFI